MTMKQILQKLKNPAVLYSVLFQIIAILILMGVKIDEDAAITIAGIVISILASLGVIHMSDTTPNEIETAYLTTSSGEKNLHVRTGDHMRCVKTGTKYAPPGSD